MHYALQHTAATLLIDAGVNVNIRPLNSTVLHIASQSKNVNIVHMLLTHGADVNAIRPVDGATPLQAATWGNATEVVPMLIDAGAYINYFSGTRFGSKPPLQLAVEQGNIDLVRMLFDAGADIDAVVGNGATALQTAVNCGHEDIVKLLLDLGANSR
jgi:uncharacterized protein